MSSPICKCETQSLAWGIKRMENKHSMYIECKTCEVRLEIPHKSLVAGFKLDSPYPAGSKRKAPVEDDSEPVTTSNVIYFPGSEPD